MITAVHTLLYSDDPDATRAFLSDVLEWPNVDAGGGWLIYKTGPSEMGIHPTSGQGFETTVHHEISLMCDDVESTVAELTAKGAEFDGGILDRRFGRTIMLNVPGAGQMMLYQPTHPPAFDLS